MESRGFFKVRCDLYDEVTFQLSERASDQLSEFLPIAISSKASVREGIAALRASPFRTVFVVDLEAQKPLFAISQNEEFVKKTRKKGGGGGGDGDPPIPESPLIECCNLCDSLGYDGCYVREDMHCICLTDDGRDDTTGLDEPLESLP